MFAEQLQFIDYLCPTIQTIEPDAHAVRNLYERIHELDIDFALVCGPWRLEHREPVLYAARPLNDTELRPRNFYALIYQDWLVGVEHYLNSPRSMDRVQRGLAKHLIERGWQPQAVDETWCEDEWLTAAHRLPRLLFPGKKRR